MVYASMRRMTPFPLQGAAVAGLLAAALCGCAPRETTLERQDLFTLDIGRLEGEIDLYSELLQMQEQKSSIAMTDGLFYITNSVGQKITRYNSYGDLLFMIYNAETNPPLLDIPLIDDITPAVTHWAISFPLQNPGAIAIDSKKHIFVADRLASDRRRYDAKEQVLYDSLLLHFDANGKFIEYFGRQGKGGSPLPHIEQIAISANDDLAAVTKVGGDYVVYWFSADGALRHQLTFRNDDIPARENRENGFAVLDGVAVAPDERIIYLKADYYRETFDGTTGIRSGSTPDGCGLLAFSVDTNRYIDGVNIPFYEKTTVMNGRRTTEELFYTMLGVLKNKEVMFFFPVDTGYAVMSLKAGGAQNRKRGFITVNPEELEYSDFDLTPDGIICALLATEWEAKVVWWQTK